jgi:hypothetical protein
MNIKKIALVAMGSFALSGCATVMHGANQTFIVESDPVGATVKFSNGATCVTPCKLELPRRYDFRTDLSLDGYRPVYVLVRSKTGGATFGNLLAGGIVGAVVDSSNGANKQLSPNPLKVRLTPVGQTTAEVLLDKKGKETGTVEDYNNKVRVDVAKSIGPEAAGLPAAEATPAPAGN